MIKPLNPNSIHPTFGQYAHGVEVAKNGRYVFTSGQLGISKDGAIPENIEAQALICFDSIIEILKSADMNLENIVQLRAFVTAREYFKPYMDVRDRVLGGRSVASTLLIVGGFTKEEFKIEIEALAVSQD